MPKVCILIAASPNAAFFSQIAAISMAVGKLRWARWEPSILVSFGGDLDLATWSAWLPHLARVDCTLASSHRWRQEGVWAQSDDVFRMAPLDADVLLAMDADTLPVGNLEDVLDQVLAEGSVAGVIAHHPLPRFKGFGVRQAWEHAANGLVGRPLDFTYRHSLEDENAPIDMRQAPFYVNFGVVFFARAAFDAIIPRYLALRPQLMTRLHNPVFSGQVALTLAITDTGVLAHELPMRFNFPNDPVAERMYPQELRQAVVFHYLRTGQFDRQHIFASEPGYHSFLGLPLQGVNKVFQDKVREIIGLAYPFSPKLDQ